MIKDQAQQQNCPFCSSKQIVIACKHCNKSFLLNKEQANPNILKFKDLPCYSYCSEMSMAQESSDTDYISDSQQSTQSTFPLTQRSQMEKTGKGLIKRLSESSDEEYSAGISAEPANRAMMHENLSAIMRLVFNLLIGVFVLALLCMVVITVRDDINKRYASEIENAMIEITKCQSDFRMNNCHKPVPATEAYCLEKEKCIAQDPYRSIKTSKTTVALAAEILNSFVQPLELKTIAVFLFIFFGTIVLCNCMMSPRVYRIFTPKDQAPKKSIRSY